MASAGEPPPPLPAGEDPFALLGVSEGADDREIRKAYARRIKVYRPDRSPAEFQRIHSAYEALISGQRATPARAAEEPAAVADEDESAATDEATEQLISSTLADAHAAASRGDTLASDRLIGHLLDQRVPLHALFGDHEYHPLIIASPAITWTRIGDGDPEGRWALWSQAFSVAFSYAPARAFALLDDDALRLDAADNVRLAIEVLDYITALAWQSDRPVDKLVESYRLTLPSHEVTDRRIDGMQLHHHVASLLRALDLPPPIAALPALVLVNLLGTRQETHEHARKYKKALGADIPAALAQLDAFVKDHTEAYRAIEELIGHSLPAYRTRLDALSKGRLAHLSGALFTAGTREWPRNKLIAIGGGLFLTVAFYTLLPPLAAMPPLLGSAYFLATETERFRHDVRPRLAKAILRSPVDSTVVARWVRLNPKMRGRLGRFEPGIVNDGGLYLFSLLACYAAEIGALDAKQDDDPVD